MTSLFVPGWPRGSTSINLQVAWYVFSCENWNPDHNKHTFRHTSRHIRVWPPYLYLAGHQDQPPVASKWPDIIFDVRNEILTLTNLYLDMHEGILDFDLVSQPGKILFFMWELKYRFCSSNYCNSNSCCSFTILKALAKSNGNLFAIAFKSDNYC